MRPCWCVICICAVLIFGQRVYRAPALREGFQICRGRPIVVLLTRGLVGSGWIEEALFEDTQ